MAADAAVVTAAALSLTQSVGAYSFFLPRLADVRQASSNDPTMRGDVRMGQVAAAALSIGIGVIMSMLVESPLPAVVAVAVSFIIAMIYSTAQTTDHLLEK